MKIIFLDIDGTVLSHKTNSIPSSALHSIIEARKQGILVFGCTGRHQLELQKLPIDDLHVDGWITMNGALNYLDDGTVISGYPIDKQDIEFLYASVKQSPFPIQFLEANEMYMNLHDDYVEKSLNKIHSKQDPIQPIERILENDIYMFIPWVKEELFKNIQDKLKSTVCVRWNKYAVDCFNERCGKKQGIQDILNYYQIDKEDAGCVGDADNDISMFQACGHKVAMGNATKELKDIADFITNDIDEDGLEIAIKYLVKRKNIPNYF